VIAVPGKVPNEEAHDQLGDAVRVRTVGDVVHVLDATAGACRPAIVTGHGEDVGAGSVPMLQLRVLMPTPAGMPAGSEDVHGWYRHHVERRFVASPDGSTRPLDSWHGPLLAGVCPGVVVR